MIFVDIVETQRTETKNSPRRRILEQWSVLTGSANNPNISIHYLEGRVVREADGSTPSFRITKTSPIVSCEADVVTTASGSKYTLGTVSESWANEQGYSESNPKLPEKYWNNWINGSNWLTI